MKTSLHIEGGGETSINIQMFLLLPIIYCPIVNRRYPHIFSTLDYGIKLDSSWGGVDKSIMYQETQV